jgi:serine/threonine protein kinase
VGRDASRDENLGHAANGSVPSEDGGAMMILSGVYRGAVNERDQPCKLKIASRAEQVSRLDRERSILGLIMDRDTNLERRRFLVSWLHPLELLSEDRIHFLDESGDPVAPAFSALSAPSSPIIPMRALVLECGGLNLKDFLKSQSYLSVPVSQRIQILEEIVEALGFLHGLGIVHFDLKPENIVSFASAHKTRWKLIDFDSSYDERAAAASERCVCSRHSLRLTESYAAPEVAKVQLQVDPSAESLVVDWRVDIWSLGLVAFFLFTNHSFWDQYSSSSASLSVVSTVSQKGIQLVLSRLFGPKEKSFLESCLQVDRSLRLSAADLLKKSLFQTSESTVHASALKVSDDSSAKLNQLVEMLTRYQAQAQNLISDELVSHLDELYSSLTSHTERVQSLTVEELRNLSKN